MIFLTQKQRVIYSVFVILFLLSCSNGSGGNSSSAVLALLGGSSVSPAEWTWMSGRAFDTIGGGYGLGVYGTKGVADPANFPGGRQDAMQWIDSSDQLWLFGGTGRDPSTAFGQLNDLWKFDGSNWTWIAGSNTVSAAGTYGTKGVAASGNTPGARVSGTTWVDSSGNLWLFGGSSDANGSNCFNDLWKFDGVNWTWMGGQNTMNANGVYGTMGVANPSNYPGARQGASGWIDSTGNVWIFGAGPGMPETGSVTSNLNDLWKFDGTNWTWVAGSKTFSVPGDGNWGTKGVAAASNLPSSRGKSVYWIDSSNNLWLLGGTSYDGNLNDVWKFDGTNWTWMEGSDTPDVAGVYGKKNIASSNNVIGARSNAIGGRLPNGLVWVFGGSGDDSNAALGQLNDLWIFDGKKWTWKGGTDLVTQAGVFGLKGTTGTNYYPGGRFGSSGIADSKGNIWIFGGQGIDANGNNEFQNDLWKVRP
ncbi:galactose oxidase [Leptospira langatensis]|uniref:Galactose oxidase n=1 Tax=Leptospira langatensis TaxID=2484983 RepID=A0A5F1ZV17_9LEPT|nr:kelch repeat-containing protein [Leptospira langatensis]TGK00315.1 galactose oxidase [Leptospira langatensis]TGL41048.1 galactose oxidase [Leptospira langatensis]